MMRSARVTLTYASPDWPTTIRVVPVDTETALKRRRRANGVPFHRSGPGWAELDQPESWTYLGTIPPHVERIDWLPGGGESPCADGRLANP